MQVFSTSSQSPTALEQSIPFRLYWKYRAGCDNNNNNNDNIYHNDNNDNNARRLCFSILWF